MITTNLKSYKEARKIRKIVKELSELDKKLTEIIKTLVIHKKYVPIRDILSNILDNKALINVYLKKYKNLSDKMDKNE